jgi:hypothetical protein
MRRWQTLSLIITALALAPAGACFAQTGGGHGTRGGKSPANPHRSGTAYATPGQMTARGDASDLPPSLGFYSQPARKHARTTWAKYGPFGPIRGGGLRGGR